ncbi:hypothetical protein DFH05DRAFT_1580164, partial [Lentinula detonsa]
PEPMNATTHHPKVNVSLTLAEPYFVAGDYISGKMEMDCKADKGLGIGVIVIELFATQELTSRDHSARSTFIHARRLFQGPGLPPSNAVQAHPLPGDPPLPLHYHQAKRGHSTFLFRLPLPATSPSSISFGSGLASVNYEVRASVGVSWKGERQLVTNKKDADVVEAYDEERIGQEEPEVTVVGENGKIWCQARLIGGILIAGESACIELQVKNHSAKKNTGLSISLNRSLHLPNLPADERPLQISDTVTTIPFRGPEYIIPPGVEGVASLVFDVPKRTKGVRGGLLLGDESEALGKNAKGPRTTQGLFEVNCVIDVKMIMGFGNKDILVEMPVIVVHPSALPELPPPEQYPGYLYNEQQQIHPAAQVPYMAQSPSAPFPSQPTYLLDQAQAQAAYVSYPALPMSPGPPGPVLATGAYVDPNQNLVWLPPPIPFVPTASPQPYQQPYLYPPTSLDPHTQYSMSPEASVPYSHYGAVSLPSPPRASSAGPRPLSDTGLGKAPGESDVNGEEGTGQRASRISQTLRVASQAKGRGRSASPVGGRRYPSFNGGITGTAGISHPALAPLPPLELDFEANTLPTPLHSPRPVLSPKRSFTKVTEVSNGGGMISKSVPKSERVEELERMADEVGTRTKDLSGDLPSPSEKRIDVDVEKPPPVPSMSDKARFLSSKPRHHTHRSRSHTPPTPATPTLIAVATPRKSMANGYLQGYSTRAVKAGNGKGKTGIDKSLVGLGLGVEGRAESGLDVLERKLLAEVGTRKVVDDKRPDVRSKPSPIEIPRRDSDRDPLNDSAISSLTLPDCVAMDLEERLQGIGNVELDRDRDSDEKTHKGGLSKKGKKKKNSSRGTLKGGQEGKEVEDEIEVREERKKEKEKEKKVGKKKGKDRTSASKGRVAAWLGAVEAEPPLDDVISPSPSPQPSRIPELPPDVEPANEPFSDALSETEAKGKELSKTTDAADSSHNPDPRSSGFVPIGTLKRDIYQRTLVPKDSPLASTNPSEDARRITDIWNHRDAAKHAGSPVSNKTFDARGKNPWQSVVGKGRLAVLPAKPSDPEVKYDVKSARGGRGGRVTAAAAIWASGAANTKPVATPPSSSSKKTTKPPGKLFSPLSGPKFPVSASSSSSTTSGNGINGRHVTTGRTNVGVGVKVTSAPIPAVMSSSHAKPTLSTTASLARPTTAALSKVSPINVPPTISEFTSEIHVGSKSSASVSNAKVGKPGLGLGAGKAANNLRAVTNSGLKNTPGLTAGEHLAFGQARLRDLIKKYQG